VRFLFSLRILSETELPFLSFLLRLQSIRERFSSVDASLFLQVFFFTRVVMYILYYMPVRRTCDHPSSNCRV